MTRNRQSFTRICSILAAALLLLPLMGCGHIHKWQAATCTAPKTCAGCGETQGEKTRHNVPEDGVCTLCKRNLSNVLSLEPKERPIAPVVYGGVFLRSYIYSDAYGNMFPGQYTIYAEDGAAIASGNWGAIDWVDTGPSSASCPEFADTEYISLQPGNYEVAFTYYTKYKYDDKITKTFIPLGDPVSATFNFIVK